MKILFVGFTCGSRLLVHQAGLGNEGQQHHSTLIKRVWGSTGKRLRSMKCGFRCQRALEAEAQVPSLSVVNLDSIGSISSRALLSHSVSWQLRGVRGPRRRGSDKTWSLRGEHWWSTCVPVVKWKWKSFSRVRLFATPWTIQSIEFSRPEC